MRTGSIFYNVEMSYDCDMVEKLRHEPRPVQAERTGAAEHEGVAERFRYFLEARGLSREAFVAAVDGAVTAKTLYTLLDGTRRPSRALAVLIERTWGFRAEFLLAGEGAMWTRVRPEQGGGSFTLGDGEARLIACMRRSLDNARELEECLERTELWEQLFSHVRVLLAELEVTSQSDDPTLRARYPAFVRLVYDECLLLAEQFARLTTLAHRRRVHRLVDRYLKRFVMQLGATQLGARQRRELSALLAPVDEQREQLLSALSDSMQALRLTLTRVSELGSPAALFGERERNVRRHLQVAEQLRKLAETTDGASARTLHKLARELGPSERDQLGRGLSRMLSGLLSELDGSIARETPLSVAELMERRRRVIALLSQS
jgi:hypothetical protein